MPDARRDLTALREKIGGVDLELLRLLEARARCSREVRALAEGAAATAPADVEDGSWLERLRQQASGDLPEESLAAIFHVIRAEARALESPARVAYVGPEGSFCHAVARQRFGAASEFLEAPTSRDALDEVTRGRAAFAVVPLESSEEGLVAGTLAALSDSDLSIVAETTARNALHLMNVTGNGRDVEKLYTTAAAHAACSRLLSREHARTMIVDVRSPIVAAQLAAGDHGGAAIVPEGVGDAAGLRVALANVSDSADQRVRYVVVGTRPTSRSGRDATCLVFSVDDTPGALFAVLRHFAERGVNLKKLQSRPAESGGWDYRFFVEVSGHVTDRPVVTALEAVKKSTKYLRVLGSFPTEA